MVTVVVALLVAAFVIYIPNLTGSAPIGGLHSTTTPSSSTSGSFSYSSTTLGAGPGSSLLITNGTVTLSYPPAYQTLASYAVAVINHDRNGSGLGTVTLSPITSAQQHADSMLFFGYFSHFDTQGYKPYIRYSLLGGVGEVEENIAFVYWNSPYYTAIDKVEKSISELEYSMMYNDSACCNNGHRDNILNPLHDRVSIGIAYNDTALYFVEDFENYYIDLNVVAAGQSITFQGIPVNGFQEANAIAVFFDSTPSPENVSALNTGPREYDPGTLIGQVFPQCSLVCPVSQTGITVYADAWEYSSGAVGISFSLAQFYQRNGSGVYTLYLINAGGSNTIESGLTSISIFLS